jgi:signal transduction histidine kinase
LSLLRLQRMARMTLANQANNLRRQAEEKAANMTESSKADIIGSTLLCVALIAAGLAGNYFRFPIFLNIDFLFGSIFAMLILQFFGLGRGILAAAISSGYTYVIWNHPYAIIIMTAEVAVVGWLTNRRKIGIVLADTLYWLIIGMPLVYLFYHVVMNVPFSNTSIVMTKQAVNGIVNALVARLIFTGFTLRSRSSLMSYREIIYNLLALFVLGPALIMMAIGSRTDFAETDLRIRILLIQESQHTTHSLETWVANRASAIFNLAEMAASRSPEQMQSYLELTVNSDVNFQRAGLQDREATTTAYFPLLDEQGHKNIGMSFADRPYIPILKQTLKPMLSEVMMGKIGTHKPVVAMIAPVVINGEYGGFIGGILSLKQILERLDKSTGENASIFTLIDKNGNVITTNRTDQTVMTPFVRGEGTLNRLNAGISQWVPVVSPNTPISERWKNSFYIAESTIGAMAEWKLILEQPVAPFQKTLYDNYTGKLTLLFLILIGALALAEFLSRSSIATLEKLRLITHDLPRRLVTDEKDIDWPESGIIEINHLIKNFREIANTLTAQFSEVRKNNETLEHRVAQEVAKNRQHEFLLIQQSRMAAMGEMIGNIAHQWRQPLNALGLLLYNIKDAYQFNTLDAAYLDQTVADGRRMVQKMSTTISDFANFFRPNKEVIVFSALEQIKEAIALVESSFQHSNISIHNDTSQDIKLMGFPNEYSQVLLNLLSNAKEAILAHNQTLPGRVDIVITEQNGQGCVSVRDNGGGIPADILDRIFEPYFSTKGKGSGIGLYMSKMIVERSMMGSITAKNIEGGAEFSVCTSLTKDGPYDSS